jgi:recombinational DNA repair ATPase RecF
MRLLELEISNIRGIKTTKLKPSSANFIVWGPNGSGKSAVVDAIDFLFTGKISRLIGEGTGGISLKAHGPHVDHEAGDAKVRGLIKIAGYKNPVTIQRSIASPNTLEHPTEAETALRPILDIASKGQLVLSRRQILKFIATEPSKRASEVQALLDLSELEEIRKALTRAENVAKGESNHADTDIRSAQRVLHLAVGLSLFDGDAVLAKVNELRKVLSGNPIPTLSTNNIKAQLTAPAMSGQIQGVNPRLLRTDSDSLKKTLEDAGDKISRPDKDLRVLLGEIRANASTLKRLKQLQLFKMGISLVEESGTCPLCGKVWPRGELARHLKEHIAETEALAEKMKSVEELAAKVVVELTNVQSILVRTLAAAGKLEMTGQGAKVKELSEMTAKLIQDLEDPLEKYPGSLVSVEIVDLFPTEGTVRLVEGIVQEAENRLPPLTPEQAAWDALTRIEENVKAYNGAETTKEQADKVYALARFLSLTFEQSRDAILTSLYKNIESRFTDLYRAIHSEDESEFESQLRPEGAGLTLEVDFHHRGKFPPLAVHSEGHQDTMGFCLYLALAEKLDAGLIDLIVLDDVVMSVDSGHRRQICQLLKDKFPDKQFAITTHDKTWARQLESTGVVSRQNSIEFSNWTIDSGPLVAEADLWSKLEEDLRKEDISSAAHRLRRGAEQFFEFVCDNLRVKVTYKSSGRYELSDFADGAVSIYKKYLRQAKASAQSWDKRKDIERIIELETIAGQVIARSNVERWAVNENVHYNRWGEFSKEDFIPVSEAFRDLLALFQCQECNATLFAESNASKQTTALRCNCGKVNWNLLAKK